MLENKLRVGVFIDNLKPGGSGKGNGALKEVSLDVKGYACGSSAKAQELLGEKVLHLTEGGNDFLFLPWVGDALNYVESQGKDVLSGPFTGCVMTAYTRNGSRRVGHVATPGCNELWMAMKKEGTVKVLSEFKPTDVITGATAGTLTKGGPSWFGLITADDKCYSMLCDYDSQAKSYKVVAVSKV